MGKGVSAGKIASNVQKKITRAQEKVRNPITCSSLKCRCRNNSSSFILRLNNRFSILDNRVLIILCDDRIAFTNVTLFMPARLKGSEKAMLVHSDDWRIKRRKLCVPRTQAYNTEHKIWGFPFNWHCNGICLVSCRPAVSQFEPQPPHKKNKQTKKKKHLYHYDRASHQSDIKGSLLKW